jgi:c(7)-type cytochrome triheme protein
LIADAPFALAQAQGVKKKRSLPDQFGNVVMNTASEKSNVAPVLFSHWVHRTRYTCRLCHVDIGFAMQAGGTGVREDDNRKGYYCGACHNGTEAFAPQTRSGGEAAQACDRCHSVGKEVARDFDFAKLTADLPRGRFGNNIDWEAAEEEGKLTLKDTLPGVSVQRKPLQIPADYDITAKITGLPEIVFSHKKHAVWNGCELCHPDVFAVKRGATKYSMEDTFAGKYCGLCHSSVAFPAIDCQRCHTKPVAQ